ncbi:MAG: leucine/isoleucine/valine transporter permease subunit [Chloroflexota bacterium]
MNLRSSIRAGFLSGFINLFVVLLGLTTLLGGLIQGWFDLSSGVAGAWFLILGIAFWGGTAAARSVIDKRWSSISSSGLFAGVAHGFIMGTSVMGLRGLVDHGVEVRKWLVQLTPSAVDALSVGSTPFVCGVIMFAIIAGASIAGALISFAAEKYEWGASVRGFFSSARDRMMAWPTTQRISSHERFQPALIGISIVLLLLAPLGLGRYWNYTLGTVGIYVILGLGLNIVVGYAGLLDLGYVAFFAIGAYTVALLTAPMPHAIEMSFWPVVIIGVVIAAISGVLLGIPVLRMRGDYLAIVTLAFGEIIRILSRSEVLADFAGGPRGIRAVAGPRLFGLNLSSGMHFMYLIFLGIVLVVFITNRLKHSRVGRAWAAMREDEDVAEAMGIHTLRYKLLAFAIGAAFAGLSGVIFASRNKFTGPEDFTLMVSINVLCLVIIGGMGSTPGVIAGALVLKGLPEILRELDDYRMLVFGALLVLMMIVRPEGIWPSARRKMELHEELGHHSD